MANARDIQVNQRGKGISNLGVLSDNYMQEMRKKWGDKKGLRLKSESCLTSYERQASLILDRSHVRRCAQVLWCHWHIKLNRANLVGPFPWGWAPGHVSPQPIEELRLFLGHRVDGQGGDVLGWSCPWFLTTSAPRMNWMTAPVATLIFSVHVIHPVWPLAHLCSFFLCWHKD